MRDSNVEDRRLDRIVAGHKAMCDTYRKQIAEMVVRMGYEPRCWAETLEIAKDLVAGKRGPNGPKDD
jgi:hypothetical protein